MTLTPKVSNSIRGLALLLAALALALTLALMNAKSAQAATLTVTNTSDNGAGSLRQAIAKAASGDTIDFDLTGAVLVPSR